MTRPRSFVILAAVMALSACRVAESAPAAGSAMVTDVSASLEPDAGVTAALRGLPLYDLGSSWTTQQGDSIALGDLAGRVRVIALVYTSCHGTCPLIVGEMKRIESAIPAGRGGDVGFVLVSLDPARDTPGRLAQWGTDNHLDADRWTLLNGSDGVVRELAATLGVRYQVQPDGEVAHANVITVVDADGLVVHQQATLGEHVKVTSAVVNRLLP